MRLSRSLLLESTRSAKEILDKDDSLVAVPFGALTPTRDNQDLVLQAGQNRIEQAATFGKDNWPQIRQAGWGERWGQPPQYAIYTRGADAKLRSVSSSARGLSIGFVEKINKASKMVGMTI